MSKAILDPRELQIFAQQLDKSREQIREQKTAALTDFARLHDTWRDEKYMRFEQVFAESMKGLEAYLQQTERYSNFLKQKAGKAQRYLDGR